MADPYTIRNTRGQTVASITTGKKDSTSTSLILHGRGLMEYGLDRDQNLIFLLEHFSNTTPPTNPIDGQLWWKHGEELFVFDEQAGSPAGFVSVIPPPLALGFNVVAGSGLTGGGFPTASPLSSILNVGAGTGITISANAVAVNPAQVVHDNLSGFVANEHINHGSVNLVAGNGLTGGGNITSSITFTLVAGDGLQITSDAIEIDNTVVTTRAPGDPGTPQTVGGIKTFTSRLLGDGSATDSAPSFSFDGDTDTGIYMGSSNEIRFVTGGNDRFEIDTDRILNTLTSNYETLVIDDDDIPNKKYVDDTVGAGTAPTSNTHVGVNNLSGLDGDQVYLVAAYGIAPFKSNDNATLSSIGVYTGNLSTGFGTLRTSTASQTINWPDGDIPTFAQQVCDMNGDTTLNVQINDPATGGARVGSSYLVAVQLTNN